jgi:hypothetical protein
MNKATNVRLPWYRQRTVWTAIAGFFTALGAYVEGSLGLTGVISAGFGAVALVFVRQGIEASTYIPDIKERGEEVK